MPRVWRPIDFALDSPGVNVRMATCVESVGNYTPFQQQRIKLEPNAGTERKDDFAARPSFKAGSFDGWPSREANLLPTPLRDVMAQVFTGIEAERGLAKRTVRGSQNRPVEISGG